MAEKLAGTVYYDGDCGFCTRLAEGVGPIIARRGFTLATLQDPGASEQLGVPPDRLLDEMKVKTADGRVIGGADSVVYLARTIWWAWPYFAISKIPGVLPIMRKAYATVAARRGCTAAACEVSDETGRPDDRAGGGPGDTPRDGGTEGRT